MAKVSVAGATLTVRFGGIERLFLGRSLLDIPILALRHVEPLRAPLTAARGGHSGFLVSGVSKIGYWGLGTGVRQLVCAAHRPGLRMVLDTHTAGCKYDEVILSHLDNEKLVASLARATRKPGRKPVVLTACALISVR